MPASALARIIEAYRRAVVALPASFDSLNAELLRPNTELTLGVVLAVFAGLSIPALGHVGPMILGFKDSLDLGAPGVTLDRATRAAASAPNEQSLGQAAEQLRAALAAIGPGPLRLILQRPEFGQLRTFVSGMRAQLFPPDESPTRTTSVANPAVALPSSVRTPVYWVLGVAGALGLVLIAAGMAPRRTA